VSDRIDFFISNSSADNQWAEWIARLLEQEGYSTFCGSRDLMPGVNLVSLIQEYAEKADNFIIVLSPSYFASTFNQIEVSAILRRGEGNNFVIPVKVAEVQLTGNFSNLSYINLCNVDEAHAKEALLKAAKGKSKRDTYLINKSELSGTLNTQRVHKAEARFPGAIPTSNVEFNGEEIILGGDEKVQAIQDAFGRNNTVSSTLTLSGLGGTGKTVIAKKYVYQYRSSYDLIWWIDAHDANSILAAYAEFVNSNQLFNTIANESNSGSVVNVVKKWMMEADNWLFVYDGVVDFNAVQSFIPKRHKGKVLITSRNSLWKNSDISTITIEVFSQERAIKFLKLHGVKGKDQELAAVADVLGNIPASLKKTAEYIVENNLSVIDFLKQYRLETDGIGSANTYINIASVYKEQGDYSSALKYYNKSLKLLQEEQKGDYVGVYISIASVYQEMGDYENAEKIYNKVLNIIRDESDKNSLVIDGFELGTIYNNLATIFCQKKRYEDAIQEYSKALEIFKALCGADYSSIATTLNNLAKVYLELGEHVHALDYYCQALSIREKILGLSHPDTAKTYAAMAEIYDLQKDYDKSILLYKKALNIFIDALGEETPYIAAVYTKIASIYQKKACYQEALEYYNKAIKIQHSSISSDNVVLNSINIIGEDNNITQITSLTEGPISQDNLKIVIDALTKRVFSDLEQAKKSDYTLFKNHFSEFQRIIRIIKKELIFETTDDTEICHYSKLSTLKYIIQPKGSTFQPRLRISNIAYLNDPSEGNVLFQLLKKVTKSDVTNMLLGNEIMEENKLAEVPFSKVFIGSFSAAKNKLPMWTLYGDNSKGCCLVFDNHFFDKRNELVEAQSNMDDKKIPSQELILYQVKYLNLDYLNETDPIISHLKKIANILDLFANIISKYDSVRIWVMTLLDEIRFLFKDSDYDYENEVRIIIHAQNAEIQVDDGINELNIPRLYVNLQRKLIYKEVILGSKIDRPNTVAPFLLHSGMVNKVTKSGINYQ